MLSDCAGHSRWRRTRPHLGELCIVRPIQLVHEEPVPAYTRFAPLLEASSTSAGPIPRFAPSPTLLCLHHHHALLANRYRRPGCPGPSKM